MPEATQRYSCQAMVACKQSRQPGYRGQDVVQHRFATVSFHKVVRKSRINYKLRIVFTFQSVLPMFKINENIIVWYFMMSQRPLIVYSTGDCCANLKHIVNQVTCKTGWKKTSKDIFKSGIVKSSIFYHWSAKDLVIGPFLFFICVNDIAYRLDRATRLFADATSLLLSIIL